MKKLMLVTLLAVAASWLLSEARQAAVQPSTSELALQEGDRVSSGPRHLSPTSPPELAPPPKAPRQKKGDASRSKTVALSSTAPATKQPPSWFPKTEIEEEAKARPDGDGSRVLVGRISASEDRAKQDLRKLVEQSVADWIASDVPTSWKVPAPVFKEMIQASYVQEVTKGFDLSDPKSTTSLDELYTLYRAGQKLDFSPSRRADVVRMYRQDLANQRMQKLGGGLALALVTLAVLSGYIKADEATKGYYTNRLRFVAAAGLGAAGVVAYRFLV